MTDIRPAVLTVLALMPAPSTDEASEEFLDQFRAAMGGLLACGSLSAAEAAALLPLLDPAEEDDLFGMRWTVLHAIETAPPGAWVPPPDAAGDETWRGRLRRRWDNAAYDDPR